MAAMLIWEKRLLFGSTAGTLLAFLFQIIAVATTNWVVVDVPEGFLERNNSGIVVVVLTLSSGLWRACEQGYKIESSEKEEHEECSSHNFFPSIDELRDDDSINVQLVGRLYPSLDLLMRLHMEFQPVIPFVAVIDREQVIPLMCTLGAVLILLYDYMRTGSAFGIISLLIMFLGHLFAFYTLRRPRYIIKRLTSLMHFMTAACVLVENEVFIRKVDYIAKNLPTRIPTKASYAYGFSFVFSWISFVFYVIAGAIFLFSSHKRKAEMADIVDERVEEDEPVDIRR